ncbi:RCC1/BLIP-II protein [Saitoella complicata NRRL Y-17804]|uniref:Uncharacterized protein n=1 Tax=Saitoella complicata (strain BCRC 22490 / CBS 7301 / JCM 7358 / NBRC 10748 / NRRL Y-17804) TaxID=698492 RepID=A0A0E9NSE2_SAICN|nr:RCC1/BLIP-II protein [Saitoella complicata NRRL Y-17804]ODQ56430.1 RCC1/BLIP-II protein [Saitoella complicata NRRL Y-17804]GAO52576.1 hypothetical protein G7K_6649-t1 [Saitoella complicata NRRL Y-17804]
MFAAGRRQAYAAASRQIRTVHSAAFSSQRRSTAIVLLGLSGAVATYGVYAYNSSSPIDLKEARDQKFQLISGVEADVQGPGVFAWGSNLGGVLAPTSKEERVLSPRRLKFLDAVVLRDLALREDVGVAVTENGDLLQWGVGYSGLPRATIAEPEVTLKGKNVVQVSLSESHVFALSKGGKVYALPISKAEQQSGTKPSESAWWGLGLYSRPSDISYVTIDAKLNSFEKFKSIAAGHAHLLLLTSSSRLLTVPMITAAPFTAVPLPNIPELPITQIATGDLHSLALAADGSVYSWGHNELGQCGQDFAKNTTVVAEPTPVPLNLCYPRVARIQCIAIAAGGHSSFYVVKNGEQKTDVFSSGFGQYGQLGNGSFSQSQYRPTKLKSISSLTEYSEAAGTSVPIGIKSLVCGLTAAGVVLDNASVDGFGRDLLTWGTGATGNGKKNNVSTPAPVPTGEGKTASEGSRLQLQPQRKVSFEKDGKTRWVNVEDTIIAGRGVMAMYSRAV